MPWFTHVTISKWKRNYQKKEFSCYHVNAEVSNLFVNQGFCAELQKNFPCPFVNRTAEWMLHIGIIFKFLSITANECEPMWKNRESIFQYLKQILSLNTPST